MMKLILSLTLTWALSSTAGALQCQTCTNSQCSSTVPVTCSSETACITASIQAASSGTTVQQIFKACAPPSLCPAPVSQTFSANVGVASAVVSLQCCNTDSCNSETLPFPAAQTNNTLQCLTCNPFTSQCTTPVQCTGVEDRCFQVTVTSGSSTSPLFGCASANLCKAVEGLGSIPFLSSLGNITSGPSCCGTSLCNKVSTTSSPTTSVTAATQPSTQPATQPSTQPATQPATNTTASDAFCIRLGMIHLLLGLLIFTLC